MKIQRPSLSISLVLGICSLICVVAASKHSLLGIAPQDEKYFNSEIIKCRDGSKKFTKARLNDDFCDCPDGTDEPGTSACPEGEFFCLNTGHLPRSLFSSRVNDGICDCCDGSDEYDGEVKCPNTCREAGRAAMDKLKKKIATYQEGVTIRKHDIEQAKQAIANDEVELSKLKGEEKMLKRLVKKLKERKEQIEKAEEKERLQKEKEEMMKEEARKKANKEKIGAEDKVVVQKEVKKTPEDDKIGLLEEAEAEDKVNVEKEAEKTPEDDTIGLLEESPIDQRGRDGSESTEGLSKEELGRLVASRWTGENTGHQSEEIDTAKDDNGANNKIPESANVEDYDNYASEINEENPTQGVDDMEDKMDEEIVEDDHDVSSAPPTLDLEDQKEFSDITTLSSASWLDKIQQTVQNIFEAVNFFQAPVDKADADRVQKEYDESSTKLSEIESRISSLTEKLKHDFGVEKEFYSLYDHCFETKQNKYVYKVCPFKEASQEEGHSRTELGHWEKFENSYSIMLFSNGLGCWNGPDRSLKVKLRCGLNTEITDVDEPSRCEYVAVMSTPALCLEGRLKELEHKLELMNKERPQSHDEL